MLCLRRSSFLHSEAGWGGEILSQTPWHPHKGQGKVSDSPSSYTSLLTTGSQGVCTSGLACSHRNMVFVMRQLHIFLVGFIPYLSSVLHIHKCVKEECRGSLRNPKWEYKGWASACRLPGSYGRFRFSNIRFALKPNDYQVDAMAANAFSRTIHVLMTWSLTDLDASPVSCP